MAPLQNNMEISQETGTDTPATTGAPLLLERVQAELRDEIPQALRLLAAIESELQSDSPDHPTISGYIGIVHSTMEANGIGFGNGETWNDKATLIPTARRLLQKKMEQLAA